MKVILFGATGMIGQGVLRACLQDPEIETVLAPSRSLIGRRHPKLTGMIVRDFLDLSGIEAELSGYDTCLFCLGASSAGMSEARYRRVTHDVTLHAALTLARLNPGISFVYLSAAGTDSSESSRMMWARVRGGTENALFRLPFIKVYAVRPAVVRPLYGTRSRTPWLERVYDVLGPALPLLQRVLPAYVTDTEELAQAMLALAKSGGPNRLVENRELAALAARAA